nr:unnamed protein product [Callosobruchus analis]
MATVSNEEPMLDSIFDAKIYETKECKKKEPTGYRVYSSGEVMVLRRMNCMSIYAWNNFRVNQAVDTWKEQKYQYYVQLNSHGLTVAFHQPKTIVYMSIVHVDGEELRPRITRLFWLCGAVVSFLKFERTRCHSYVTCTNTGGLRSPPQIRDQEKENYDDLLKDTNGRALRIVPQQIIVSTGGDI